MRKPRIFIASALESLNVADAFNVNLDHQAEVTVWKHGFNLSQNTIDSLVKMAESVDFAIFIFTPDDIAEIRNQQKNIVRDNVVFELGLFVGTLGKERCFIVKPRDTDLHFPTDLLGLTPADYNGERTDGNLEAAVNHPCILIKKEVASLGLLSQDLNIQTKSRKKAGYNYKLGDIEHHLLAKVLESYASSPDGVSVWSTFDDIKIVEKGILSLAAIKLERVGFLDKSIAIDHEYNNIEYYTFSITADGIDYLLENEDILQKISEKVNHPVSKKIDDDIKF
ncbi:MULTISPECIES: TIR domain-containing protein [Pectobacterium]|uniref:TIR domain-containing protein n=1 Tax=Pectobacterium TaxID=122277 RepID=UPI00193CDA22|nr:nucleotide-binding protein [Pectobacterium brasiliense]QRN32730.1 nucleotide-binding protein [Pectobacterium brasiliense]